MAPAARSGGVVLGVLMATTALGISAPAVALPALSSDLGRPVSALAWLLASYAVALALATAIAGRVVDMVGTFWTLWAGAGIAAAGTVVAVAAPGLGLVVAGRLVQGAGAGAIAVVVLTATTLRPVEQRAAVLSTMTAMVAIISGSGTLIGGALAVWHPRAALALPAVALLIAPVAARGLPRRGPGGRLDLVGAALLAATAGGVLVAVQARTTGLAPVLAVSAVGVALLGGVLLVAHSRRHADGFLPHAVVGRPVFGLVVGAAAAITAAYFAMLFAAPVLLAGQGYGPLRTGATLLPAALVGATASRLTGRWVRRAAPLPVAVLCAAVAAAGLLVGAALGGHVVGLVVAAALVLSAFSGSQVAVVTATGALAAASTRGLALGLQNMGLLVGGALGTAAAGALSQVSSPRVALALLVPAPLVGVVLAHLAHRRS